MRIFASILFVLSFSLISYSAQVSENSFSYQGHLTDANQPAVGTYDIQFQLFDSETEGTQIGETIPFEDVQIDDGTFRVYLDFGVEAFDGSVRYLEIYVKRTSGDTFVQMTPRQPITPSPYALYAREASSAKHVDSGDDEPGEPEILNELHILNTDDNGLAIHAIAAGAGLSTGIKSQAHMDVGGVGIEGSANIGVMGLSQKTLGVGVVGAAADSTYPTDPDLTWPAYALERSNASIGVGGIAGSISNKAYGVYGETRASQGAGVYGFTVNEFDEGIDSQSIGVLGESLYIGISGISDRYFGVVGESNGEDQGSGGVLGRILKQTSGTYYGVKGEVQNDSKDTAALFGSAKSESTGGLFQTEKGTTIVAESTEGKFIECFAKEVTTSNKQTQFYVDHDGNVFARGKYESAAADFAEMLSAGEELEPGDVLSIDKDGLIRKANSSNPQSIVGVYSSQPAFLGGSSPQKNTYDKVPVAIMGVVPTKVSSENGVISANDLLTVSPSKPGYAAKAIPVLTLDNGQAIYGGGTVLGRALERMDTTEGVIQVLIQLQ
jgi:hypothetical protein